MRAENVDAGRPNPWLLRGVGLLAAFALWWVLGGLPGAVIGTAAGTALPLGLARLETADERRRRERLVADAPLVAELLAAALAAGVPVMRALPAVAEAVGGATGAVLRDVHARCQLGEPASLAWASLEETDGLGPLARAVCRSERTGAPLAAVLRQTAVDLRHMASQAAVARVRKAGVQAVLPLGLCLLPAFVVLGVVPIVAALAPLALS